MPSDFDGYYKWLGIPPGEQPPNHYRLLGLGLFENDPDVIQAAADRQMAHLQTYKNGPQAELSQKLLNEVAAAKICLLKPQKKEVYDEQLRQQTTTAAPVARMAGAAAVVVAAAAQDTFGGNGGGSAAMAARTAEGLTWRSGPLAVPPAPPPIAMPPPIAGPQRTWPMPASTAVLIMAALVLMLAVAIGIVVAMSHKKSRVATDQTPPTQPSVQPATQGGGNILPSEKPAKVNVSPGIAAKLPSPSVLGDPSTKKPEQTKSNDPPDPFGKHAGGNPATTSPDKATTKPAAHSSAGPAGSPIPPDKKAPTKTGPDKTSQPAKAPANPDPKLLAPDEKALAAADAELAVALPNPSLADLLRQAQQARGGPAIYAALHKARDLAVNNADVVGASVVVEKICRRFTVDELELRSQTLFDLRTTVREPLASAVLAQAALDMIDEAVAASQQPLAEQLAETSLAAARRSGDNALIKKVTLRILKMRQG